MYQILKQIIRTGIKTEAAPQVDEAMRVEPQRLQQQILDVFGGALAIRFVDAGSCNGCELEIHAINNAYYNLEGLGIRFVASPRHADLLLVTGPVSRHMIVALKRTYDAMPDPKLVVAIGGCGGARLSAITHSDYARHTHRDQRTEMMREIGWGLLRNSSWCVQSSAASL
jgi:Ni,Fe-hydrogenase III small subunit